jgi:carboxypeptidase Q
MAGGGRATRHGRGRLDGGGARRVDTPSIVGQRERMRRAFAIAALVAVALAAAAAAQSPSLAEAVAADDHVMEYVRSLTAMGPRLTGTAGYEGAAEWSAGQLRAAGLEPVTLESFTIPDGWTRERAAAQIVAPEPIVLRVAALGWTPSTPGVVEAEVVALDEVAPEQVGALAARVDGRIVLLRAGDVGGSFLTATARRRELDRALARAGARAILSPDVDRDDVLVAHDRTVGATTGALPAAQIARSDADTIRRLLGNGPVRISLELRNRVVSGPMTVHNVIAEIRGRERPDEWVIVGAHLDTWDFSGGAQDNATGAAMVLEAARAIAARPARPRRSMRFALWGGEEQGQLGSAAYVRAHSDRLDRIVAYLNTDAGSGALLGWTAPGRRDVAEAARRLLEPIVSPIASIAFDAGMQYAFQSDGAAFIRAGIPTLDLNADDAAYEEIHHKPTDTIERVEARNVRLAAATVAASAVAIAEAPARFAPRGRRVN